jgi:hypothetical protein
MIGVTARSVAVVSLLSSPYTPLPSPSVLSSLLFLSNVVASALLASYIRAPVPILATTHCHSTTTTRLVFLTSLAYPCTLARKRLISCISVSALAFDQKR